VNTERGDRARVPTDHSDRGPSSQKDRFLVRSASAAARTFGPDSARRTFIIESNSSSCAAVAAARISRTSQFSPSGTADSVLGDNVFPGGRGADWQGVSSKGFELAVSACRVSVGIAGPRRSEPLASATV
jgi:hypothetical protein